MYHLTLKSSNAKTGPIPVSTSSSDTCPTTCGEYLRCYAKAGPLAIHWAKLNRGIGLTFDQFLIQIKALPLGQLWRHNQAGDLPGNDAKIDTKALNKLVEANKGKRGFTYTHKPVLDTTDKIQNTNALAIRQVNKNGFTINLSADTLEQADSLADMGIAPVVTVLPESQTTNTVTPSGRKVVVCPAVTKTGVTCEGCQLCAWKDRKVIIGFPLHGSLRRRPVNLVQIGVVAA